MKLFARGHPEGRWFKCRHSFPRPRHGWELNFTQNSPLSPGARGQSAVSSLGLTSDGCWRPEFRVPVKNTLRMPFLNSDPASRCCCQPRSGTCRRGRLDSHSLGCAGTWQLLPGDWIFLKTKDLHFWGAADYILSC